MVCGPHGWLGGPNAGLFALAKPRNPLRCLAGYGNGLLPNGMDTPTRNGINQNRAVNRSTGVDLKV
jgi:hypothetical protein